MRNIFSNTIKNVFLEYFKYESFETYKSCLLRKMTKISFTKKKGEMASDFFTLIHTNDSLYLD